MPNDTRSTWGSCKHSKTLQQLLLTLFTFCQVYPRSCQVRKSLLAGTRIRLWDLDSPGKKRLEDSDAFQDAVKDVFILFLLKEWRRCCLWTWLKALSAVSISLPLCCDLLGNLNGGGFNRLQWRLIILLQWLVKRRTRFCLSHVLQLHIFSPETAGSNTSSEGMFQAKKLKNVFFSRLNTKKQ